MGNQEVQKGFLKDLSHDLKVQFAQGERRRKDIDLAKGMMKDQWRQGVLANAIKLGEEFVQMRQVIDADEPWEVKDRKLYSRKFGCYFEDLVINRVKEHTPQNYDPQEAATSRVIQDTIVERSNRQVCSICVCPPNNSIRFLNFLTRSESNPNEVPSRSIRLAQDNLKEVAEKILEVLAKKNKGRQLLEEVREEDGQKVKVKILVCDGKENFIISEQEIREAESKILAEPPKIEVSRLERFWLLPEPMPLTPPPVWADLTLTALDRRAGNSAPSTVNPVLMFQNNRTEEPKERPSNPGQPIPPFSPESPPAASPAFVLMFQNIYTKPRKVELPTNPVEVRATVQPQGLTFSVEKQGKRNSLRSFASSKSEVAVTPRILPDQTETESGVAMEQKRVIVQEVVVKKEEVVEKEIITVPLIEIPVDTSMIYIIEAELEPIGKEQINMMEAREESQEEPEKIIEQASQEMKNEETREDVGPTEQKEPKIFAVEEFKVKPLSYINISIYENSRQEPEVEKLEIKKLVWVVSSSENQNQPAILELEFSKDPDPNKATLRFLHFLRKVARKVVAQKFGNDILRTRKIKMIRADEPVEVIRKIEYYLEVLKGTYAQVFAFVS